MEMPNHDEFSEILDRTGGITLPKIIQVSDGETMVKMGQIVRQVPISRDVQDYLVRLARSTHPEAPDATPEIKRFVRYGASPRAAQAMLAASKVKALLNGRYHVAKEDVCAVAVPAMRHRVLLSFEGEAEGISTDQIIKDIISEAR